MSFRRRNILDLIGKNGHKYSSCIITCFTFDFTFFEQRVMAVLRTANVRNINVFLDGNRLEQHMERITGHEFRTHKTFSLNPIYTTGVFHPKIMLLTGPNQGLLVIGSGNVTSSGLSSNEEVWAAFHLNSPESKNAPVFAEVWHYLQSYFVQVKGFNRQKIDWIYQYSPWLNEITAQMPTSFTRVDGEQELKFIANTPGASIYHQLQQWLPASRINKLTIVSPFFDDQGQLLEQFLTDYNIEKIQCVTDIKFGLPPSRMSPLLHERIKFYPWEECVKDSENKHNRLHAKVFQFEYEDGWEYLLIGSPNATCQAFGTRTAKAKNAEAALLLRRRGGDSYLEDLGVTLIGVYALKASAFKRNSANRGDTVSTLNWENRIGHAEKNGSKLTVYLQKKIDAQCQLQVLDTDQNILETHAVVVGSSELNISLQYPAKAYLVGLFRDENRISNFSFIADLAYLIKCSPAPKHSELSYVIESLSSDPENDNYLELLRHVEYAWIDAESDHSTTGRSWSASVKVPQPAVQKVYGSLTEEKFNQLPSVQAREFELYHDPNIQIADILLLVSKGLIKPHIDVQENIEEALSQEDTSKQNGTGDEVTTPAPRLRLRGPAEKRAIENHFDKVCAHYKYSLENLFNTKLYQNAPSRPLTLQDLSTVSILMNLIYLYLGKKYTCFKTEFVLLFDKKYIEEIRIIEKQFKLDRLAKTDPNRKNAVFYRVDAALFSIVKEKLLSIDKSMLFQQEEYTPISYDVPYLVEGVYTAQEDYGVKKYLIEALGSFLVCANQAAGFQQYPYESYQEKVRSYRKEIFEKATFLILDIRWREYEATYRDLLLLDLLCLICPSNWTEEDVDTIPKTQKELYYKAKHKSTYFFENLTDYITHLLPGFSLWKRAFEVDKSLLIKEVTSLRPGTIIYQKNIGFCSLKKAGDGSLLLAKPGFKWDSEMKENLLKVKTPQAKIIAFQKHYEKDYRNRY